jgi:hypothetical protein
MTIHGIIKELLQLIILFLNIINGQTQIVIMVVVKFSLVNQHLSIVTMNKHLNLEMQGAGVMVGLGKIIREVLFEFVVIMEPKHILIL